MTHQERYDPLQNIPLSVRATMTLDEFLEKDVEGFEYVKEELVPMPDASIRHGEISVNIVHYLYQYVREQKIGRLYTAETSFKVGDRVLKPDVAFVSKERIIGDKDKGYTIPPDLAIEVVSPSDIRSRVINKVHAYLSAGTRCVWVIEPDPETITVYHSEADIKILSIDDTLTGDDVVPGFSCPVELLFA